MRLGLRSFATVMIAMLAFVGLGTPNAGAAVSFVGEFKIHGKITGTHTHPVGTFVVNADGTVENSDGDMGTWTSSGRSFTMTFTNEEWFGTYSKTGISTKHRRGTFTVATLQGTWWAVRIA